MSRIHSFYNQFVPPKPEPLVNPKLVMFWGLNLFTFGIFGAAEAVMKNNRLKEANLVFKNLDQQNQAFIKHCNQLDTQLVDLLSELNTTGDKTSLKAQHANIKTQVQGVSAWTFTVQKHPSKLTNFVMDVISFVGYLIVNVATLGVFGVVRSHKLKNKITYLDALNANIKGENLDKEKATQASKLNKLVEGFEDFHELLNTDKGNAFAKMKQAQKDLTAAQLKQNNLQAELNDLKNDNSVLKAAGVAAANNLAGKNQAIANLEGQLADLKKNEAKLKDLQAKLNAANDKIAVGHVNEKELKLLPKLGPILPEFFPAADKKLVAGAMDLDDDMEEELDVDQVAYFKEYKSRYGYTTAYDDEGNEELKPITSANQVIFAGFNYAYQKLIERAEKGDKMIKLTRTPNTMDTQGALSVYSYMVLDFLKGGKVADEGCEGIVLKINDTFTMYPSKAEKVLHYKDGQPEVVVHFKNKDEFTPSEGVCASAGVFNGVDPVEAKWILESLTPEEQEILNIHLLSSLIEDKHPQHQKMVAFMANKKNPSVKLIERASGLIQDLAKVMERKFKKTVLNEAWSECSGVDWTDADDIKPFVKASDQANNNLEQQILLNEPIKTHEKVVKWELDPEVIKDQALTNLILDCRAKYETVSAAFDNKVKILAKPTQANQKFTQLSLKEVCDHFYVSHQMIGQTKWFTGGEHCLFSNLLAILVLDEKDLTVDNVHKLKHAMANYLDKLSSSKVKWEKVKASPETEENLKLKEQAALFDDFQQMIALEHNCTIPNYVLWLRGNNWAAPGIEQSKLTSLEIKLAAHALGVRIGLLSIGFKGIAGSDELGRIVPQGVVYGPNTKEMLMMGLYAPADGKEASFYGLYPKLNVGKNEDQYDGDVVLYYQAAAIKQYWEKIKAY